MSPLGVISVVTCAGVAPSTGVTFCVGGELAVCLRMSSWRYGPCGVLRAGLHSAEPALRPGRMTASCRPRYHVVGSSGADTPLVASMATTV